ncbi:MAG TPA: HAD family hydrolase, partial [Henriciella marina]|nr:HAD family hydrolase [Henriciella marina]
VEAARQHGWDAFHFVPGCHEALVAQLGLD